MSTQVQAAFSVSDLAQRAHSRRKLADRALKAAAGFWFVVAVLGQLFFAFTVASFYGLTAARGNWQQWNKTMTHGYTPGHPMGNLVVAIHLVSAVIILLSGALQLIPQIRATRSALPSLERPRLHRDRFHRQPCRPLYDVVPWHRRRSFATPRPEPRRRPDHALCRHGAALCIGP